MAGIKDRKMVSDSYDNSRCYNYFTKIQLNDNDIHSTKAKEAFNRPLYHLGKENNNENKVNG